MRTQDCISHLYNAPNTVFPPRERGSRARVTAGNSPNKAKSENEWLSRALLDRLQFY